MSRPVRQFVAILLTIWLPLFSGNALAVSMLMQAKGGCCPAAQADESHHHAANQHRHMQHYQIATHENQAAGTCDQPAQQGSACNNCGTCHLAGSGYLAAAAIGMAEAQPVAQSFCTASDRFQSTIPTLLDPPPLARV